MSNLWIYDTTHEKLRELVDRLGEGYTQEGVGNILLLLAISNPTVVEQACAIVETLKVPGATKFEGKIE